MCAAIIASQAAQADELRFITCPIYRDADAGKKSGCWLADDPATGARYDVSPSAAKPDWNFAVLVEGRIAAKQDNPCGGVTLDPVRTSVLELPCPRHMLPAEAFAGRKFVLPRRNVDPIAVARPVPVPPFSNRIFRLFFDWNSSFIAYQREDYTLDQMINWMRGVPVKRVIVTGYAARAPSLVSGQSIVESAAIAAERHDVIAEALTRLGIEKRLIEVHDGGNGETVADEHVDLLTEPSRRRVDVAIEIVTPDG